MIREVNPIRAWVDACPHLVTTLKSGSEQPQTRWFFPPPLSSSPLLFSSGRLEEEPRFGTKRNLEANAVEE